MAGYRNWCGILHPLHAILLAFPIALFSFAVATDIAYLNTAEIQWSNFSAWSITLALFFNGLVVAWAVIEAIMARRSPGLTRSLIYLAVLVVMFIVGLINIFRHSQDGWSSVGAPGLIMSIICAVLALIAGWLLHSRSTVREVVQ
ncbi:DUF2231 domain-containing protein [Brevundimonas sp.]|uniref:DUF2231 domain-containing protein n=1 Tax=Brevundimonas sp. TaxID=1871086 RepID=UPI001DE5F615|nr:DUF2231 domain-containing protein [Brevundimonas sp.]MBA4001300.1 hypothetical protein [Brevundimonas sp.]